MTPDAHARRTLERALAALARHPDDAPSILADFRRDAVATALTAAASDIEAAFPDPNPLASIFTPYVGAAIAAHLEQSAHRLRTR